MLWRWSQKNVWILYLTCWRSVLQQSSQENVMILCLTSWRSVLRKCNRKNLWILYFTCQRSVLWGCHQQCLQEARQCFWKARQCFQRGPAMFPGSQAMFPGSQAMFPGGQAMFPDNISKPNRTLTLTLMDLPEQMTRSQNGCSEMGPIMPHSLINYSTSGCPILVIWIFVFSLNWSQQCLLNVHSNWAQVHQIVSNKIGFIGVVLWSIEQLTTWTS